MEELFQRHNFDSVDLIKLDIEGSEFGLFAAPDWLQRVKALTMEVHPDCGDPGIVLESLSQNGFTHVMADENLQRTSDPRQAGFIYAWKSK